MIRLNDELTMDFAVMFKAVPTSALEREGKTVDVFTCAQSGIIVARDGKPVTVPMELYKILSKAYGVNTAGFNETFHKSFDTVANMSPEEYFFHQILHYFTTYGAEAVGVTIPTYVPAEALELPEGMLPVNKLTVIRSMTEEELVKQMNQFALTTKAPNEAQKSAMQRFLPYVTISTENMESFEFQVMAHDYRERLASLFNRVKALLIERLRPAVEGKTFFMPEYISYAAPYTEKQMMGHIPYGSRIMTGQDGAFTAGIHWVNEQKYRIDLDLHMRSKSEHFGWNGGYRLDDKVIFTGDQTDAPEPNGAAEAFWFEPEAKDVYILSVNEFSGPDKAKFEFVVSTQKPTESDIRSKNFIYDPAKIAFAPVPLQFNDSSDMSIGMFVGKTFYVYGGVLGDGIVPSENSDDLIDGMRHVLEQRLRLADLLKAAGAVIVNDMGELPESVAEENVVNLAPQAVTSSLLFSLVDGTYGSTDGKMQ